MTVSRMWSTVPYESWTEHEGNVTVLCVRGELDINTQPQFRRRLEELVKERPFVIVDFREVSYIDMSAIRGLEGCAAIAREHGGQVVIANPSTLVRRVLDILGVPRQIPVVASRRDALEFLHSNPGS